MKPSKDRNLEMKQITLSSEDRIFFNKVLGVVFSNPFGEKRDLLEREIVGIFQEQKKNTSFRDESIVSVERKILDLDQNGPVRLEQFSGDDRRIMKYTFLFNIYHRFINPLDAIIEKQMKTSETVSNIPFAEEALSTLRSRGFNREDCSRYFSMCFQFRRAFYFIKNKVIGNSQSMKKLRCDLWNNIFTDKMFPYEEYLWDRMEDFSTMLLGETGTGKGNAAAAIGMSGFIPFDDRTMNFTESFLKSFLSINLSQYPESLIESELFGHKKGAFTGAIEGHQGVFDQCSPHGAIFLDEIGDVSVPVQIKLLQVLQERTFSPVGTYEKRRFAGRVIAATNKPIPELRQEKKLRDDFFYRLCSDIIIIPPLRQRIAEAPDELPMLINHVLEKITNQHNPNLTGEILEVISKSLGKDYPWPGNVRELEQCIRRIIIKGDYEGDLLAPKETDPVRNYLKKIETFDLDAESLMSRYCKLMYSKCRTYEEVANKTGLDRRTVKKYILMQHSL